jgi:hypothetical protein
MKTLALLSVCTVIAVAQSQTGQTSAASPPSVWRAGLSTLPATPAPNTSVQDIAQFEKNMRMAATYLGNATPNASPAQWEANRALVRRMATYLVALRALSGSNSQLRGSVNRAQRSFDSLGLAAYLAFVGSATPPSGDAPPPPPPEASSPQMAPPFAFEAPELSDVADADKQTAADLRTRYETDAAHSAGVWQNAETLRQNLEARGLGLNLQTATSMVRLPLHFNGAANALRSSDWEGARTHLEQAEAETEKIAKTIGR